MVNRWELERIAGQWKISARALLPVDGSRAPLEQLNAGLTELLARNRIEWCTLMTGLPRKEQTGLRLAIA